MAYNTKGIKTDVDKKPIPQYYNPVTDEYQVLQGENGAARHVLYGSDGNPISTDDNNKLAVRATEIETMLTAIEGYIDGLEPAIGTPTADPAANTVLARLKTLATLIGEVQASPTANTLLARVKSLEDKLGEVQTAPTANTLLARMKSLEDKIDAITDGTTPAVTQLSGSILEYDQVKTKITSTEIALPTDLQYHNLNDATALPIRLTAEMSEKYLAHLYELERAAKIQAQIRKDYYLQGIEYNVWEQATANTLGNGGVLKEKEYLKLWVENNPNNRATYAYVTRDAVDTTDCKVIYCEVSAVGHPEYKNQITFGAGLSHDWAIDSGNTQNKITFKGELKKTIIRAVFGGPMAQSYIKIFLQDYSNTVDVPCTLYVHKIWGEK